MKKILLYLATAAMFAACGDDPEDPSGRIVLDPAQTTVLEVDNLSRTVRVAFTTDLNWIVNYVSGGGVDGWYAVDPTSGLGGEATVEVRITENETGADREGAFRIVCGSASVEFTVRQYSGDIPDNPYVSIPDEALRTYLLENFDRDGDLKLSKEEAAAITELVCEQMDIASLRGIEHMPNLEVLDISYNKIAGELDLSGFDKLKQLDCDHNPLTAVKVAGCAGLESLKANDCFVMNEYMQTVYTLARIDLTGCVALKSLNFEDNCLTELDLSDCAALEDIRCAYNDLTTLDFSACPKMVSIHCRNNPLHGLLLDVSMCPDLRYLAAWEAGLSGVDVSGCSRLEQLLVYYNDLGSIDISSCTALAKLDLHGTKISGLDLGNCPELNWLDVSYNNIDRIDLSACTKMAELYLGENLLSELDCSMCTNLRKLSATDNALERLDVSGCTQLETLAVARNALTELDLSDCSSLTQLSVDENHLDVLDVNNAHDLFILNCTQNRLTELGIADCAGLVVLDAEHNRLTNLDLRSNVLLREVYLGGNSLAGIDVRGLGELTHLEVQQNELTRIDLQGCEAIDELHVFSNRIEWLSIIPCKAIRYLDCRNTLLRSIDLSQNPRMNFLFATLNPLLKTVWILDGANYSSLSVDEGVEVYRKSPDSFDDVGGDSWGDAQIDPWENK